MTAHAIDQESAVLPTTPERLARLPLHAELFLIAHDDDTGRAHLNEQSLEVGLAGAILLELHQTRWVAIGHDRDFTTGQWRQRPGCLTVARDGRTGDPLRDAALATVAQLRHRDSPEQLRTWVRMFRTCLYERVRAQLVTVGVLRSATRHRFGILRTGTYLAVQPAWAVRIRAQIRDTVLAYERPHERHRYPNADEQLVALCGLAAVLDLTPFLYLPDLSATEVDQWRHHVVSPSHRHIREVAAAVDDGRGDLAVAAMG